MTAWAIVSALLHFGLAAAITWKVLMAGHRPVSAVLWLVIVWAFPFVGSGVYLLFGVVRVRRSAAERAATNRLVAAQVRLTAGNDLPAESSWPAILRAPGLAAPVTGNRCALLVDGDEFYPALFAAISLARSSVHVQSFIIGKDHVGLTLRDLLLRRARDGIAVRVLYDRFGSTAAHYGRLFRPAMAAGAEVRSITQAHPLKGRFQVNLRNHRKVAVVDGRIGFVGGINLHDGNQAERAPDGPIRDYHVRVEGPAVRQLQLQFLQDWFFAAGGPVGPLVAPALFPEPEPAGSAVAQVVSGGPDRDGANVADVVFGLVTGARRSLTLVTPYFVPDEPTLTALREAALRGVAVRLIVPASGNHRYAELAGRSLYAGLLAVGVRIFERAPPFMHAKAMLVDGTFAMLGSVNLDQRSLHLNFETALVVADPSFVGDVARQIDREQASSRELDPALHARRPMAARLLENACYLFQPLL